MMQHRVSASRWVTQRFVRLALLDLAAATQPPLCAGTK
jgi:hypothetical protein